jgi:lipid-binding SYLF domain-containing protein
MIVLYRAGGADIHVSDISVASAYSYSHTRGIYGGVSLEGTVIFTRHEINEKFYGQSYSPYEILTGKVPRPRAATPLYQALYTILDGKEYKPEVNCERFPPSPTATNIYAPYEV